MGKTRVDAAIALWFLWNFYPSRVITTAPTGRQNELLLWGEIRRLHAMMQRTLRERRGITDLGDDLLPKACRLSLDIPGGDEGGQWYAIGFSTDKADAFQGIHEVNILFILDEGAGIDTAIFGAVEGSLNTPNSRVLATGNPTDPSSYFGRLFLTREGSDWNKIHISCLQSPNVVAGNNIIAGLCGWDWPEKQRKKWGESDPRYLIKVLGEFPESGGNVLVSYPVAYAALNRELKLLPEKKLVLAIDVARFGDDMAVFLLREKGEADYAPYVPEEEGEKTDDEWSDVVDSIEQEEKEPKAPKASSMEKEELAAVVIKKFSQSSITDLTAETLRIVDEYEGRIEDIAIDVVGVGGGLYDNLEAITWDENSPLRNIELWEVSAGEEATDDKKCANLRAEIHRCVKRALESEELIINDEEIVDQVSQLSYKYEPKRGRLIIFPKEEFKKKYGRSPDELDTLAISYAPRVLRGRRCDPRIRQL